MSVTFRPGETLRAARLNRAIQEGGAQSGELAAAAVLRRTMGRELDEFGTVDRTGTIDMQPLINTAIEACAASGDLLVIGPGLYLNRATLRIMSNARVLCSPEATFVRDFASTAGNPPHMNTINFPTVHENISWRGGRFRNAVPSTNAGNVLTLLAHNSVLEDIEIDEWGRPGVCIYFIGDNSKLRNIRAKTLGNGGGIQVAVSHYTTVSDCHVECGDDVFQFVPRQDGAFADRGMIGCQYVNCTGVGRNNRLMYGGLISGIIESGPFGSALGNAFIGVRGRACRFAGVGNNISPGVSAHYSFIECWVDCSIDDDPIGPAFAALRGSASYGEVYDVKVIGGGILSPLLNGVEIEGPVGNVSFQNFYIGAPRTATYETVLIRAGGPVSFDGCTIEGRDGVHSVRVGVGGSQSQVNFWNNLFTGIRDGLAGIRLVSCGRADIDGNRFVEQSGQTSALAISTTTAANGVRVGANDYSGLTIAGKLQWDVAINTGSIVEAPETITITADTTARMHQSGATFILTGATGRTVTLPACKYGLSFAFAQQGTGALVVDAGAGDVLQLGSGSSSSGGTLTSGAQGSTLRLVALDDTTWLAVQSSGTWTPA